MTFDEILARILDLLQHQGRVSYRALKRRFDLDDDYLEDLKAEIIKAQRLAIDEAGEVLVWTGGAGPPQTPASAQERPLQAHCHLGLGTLYLKMARGEQARTALSTAMTMCRTMEMTFWLPQVEAALAQASQ